MMHLIYFTDTDEEQTVFEFSEIVEHTSGESFTDFLIATGKNIIKIYRLVEIYDEGTTGFGSLDTYVDSLLRADCTN
jgi:hypothetical protein